MTDLSYNQVAKIKVFGIGGAGGNAVNRMVQDGVQGVEFYVANTDVQALDVSPVQNKIQLGKAGLGAGGNPDNGRKAAVESEADIRKAMEGADMVFLTAGLGGGTGSGAAPIVAKAAREAGALTISVVTKPFNFEGSRRMTVALEGLEELRKYSDAVIIIPNENVKNSTTQKITFANAFHLIDDVLCESVLSVLEILTKAMLINIDIADINTVLRNSGDIFIGNAIAEGNDRASKIVEEATTNPLLEKGMRDAKGMIIYLSANHNVSLDEINDISNRIAETTSPDANIIWGFDFDDSLGDMIKVSIIASGVN